MANRRYNQAQQPVVGVSWEDAVAFAEWAGGRLPTGAEWEYACRAGTTTATYAGDLTREDKDPVLDGIAWYAGNSGGELHVVGQKAPNEWGLYDMLGNVGEWCSDAAGSDRVIRGGSWNGRARDVRAAYRNAYPPGFGYHFLGFRWARGQGEPAKPGRSVGAAEPPHWREGGGTAGAAARIVSGGRYEHPPSPRARRARSPANFAGGTRATGAATLALVRTPSRATWWVSRSLVIGFKAGFFVAASTPASEKGSVNRRRER